MWNTSLPRGGGGVDRLGQRAQADAALAQVSTVSISCLSERAEPVEMGYSGFRPPHHSRSGRVEGQGCDGPSRVGGDS